MADTNHDAESGTPQSGTGGQPSGPSWLRLAAIAGIVHVVVFIGLGVGIASGAPVLGESPDKIRDWFTDNDAAVSWFTWLGPAVGILLLIFAAGLRHASASCRPVT